MIEKIIHQIFIKINKDISEFPLFEKNRDLWKEWCKKNNYEYKLYSDEDIIKLIDDKDILDFYQSLRYKWCKIDFSKYIIINKLGGLYIDLDVKPNDKENKLNSYIESRDYILGLWDNNKTGKTEYTNSLLGFPKNSLNSLIKYSIDETEKKSKMKVYDIRKIRFFLHTTGVRMFKRWCKKNKYTYDLELYKYINDSCTATWLKDFN